MDRENVVEKEQNKRNLELNTTVVIVLKQTRSVFSGRNFIPVNFLSLLSRSNKQERFHADDRKAEQKRFCFLVVSW